MDVTEAPAAGSFRASHLLASSPRAARARSAHPRRRRAFLWLGVALAFVVSMLAACGADGDSPVDVSLATLATQEDAYKGKPVRTRGVVRTFESPRHYWIEDDVPNRVAVEPEELVAPLVGQEIGVVGRFDFDDTKGRIIKIKEIASSVRPFR